MKKIKNNKKFIPQLSELDIIQKEENIASLLNDFDTSHLQEGQVAKGQVIEVTPDVIIVDVGLKNEGRIPVSEFKISQVSEMPDVGDIIEVYIEKIAGNKGTILSYKRALHEKSWGELEVIFNNNENIIGTIFGRVKGGFTVDIDGVVAFLPGSQVDIKPIKDIESIMNIPQNLRILKMDQKLGNIVVSRKAIIEEDRSDLRDQILADVKEGTVLKGTVKNITDYGAFIDLGKIDGLLHVTDISWKRINHPSEVLSVNQELEVCVIKIDDNSKRISLGMKQLEKNPWDELTPTIQTGESMTGKITSISNYGVFVEIRDGIEGLVHSSEISWGKSSHNPKKLLTIGQEVEFMVLEIDPKRHRISLSMKRCKENPLIKFSKNHPVGSVIKAPIRNITDFGVFVEIDTHTDGMIHESDISWAGHSTNLRAKYNTGDMVECKVLSIDLDKDRVSLGIKQLTQNPHNNNPLSSYKKYAVVTSVITEVQDNFIKVKVDDKVDGIIKASGFSWDKGEQVSDRYAEGERVDTKIIGFDNQNQVLNLSIKALEMEQREKAIKEYGSTDSGANLRDILGLALGDAQLKSDNTKEDKKAAVIKDDRKEKTTTKSSKATKSSKTETETQTDSSSKTEAKVKSISTNAKNDNDADAATANKTTAKAISKETATTKTTESDTDASGTNSIEENKKKAQA